MARSLTQLLVFNTVKQKKNKCATVRHTAERETLLPLYLGLLIHNKTRKRELIDVLFQKGLSVSYSRVLQVSTGLANDAIASFEADGVVVPTTLRTHIYTTGNLDNIDHNPSATSAKGAFHGTAISLTQHKSQANAGEIRELSRVAHSENETQRQLKELPEAYASVPPVAIPCNNPVQPVTCETAQPGSSLSDDDKSQNEWLTTMKELLQKIELDTSDMISWSAFFASMIETDVRPPAITALLPLFRDNAHSLAMVKHGMDLIQKATHHVNPGQIPVLTVDQPLFALAKKIQWTWPDVYGEDKFVVMMGGLHIELSFLKVLGDWLEDSGWTSILATSNVTTEGRADSILKGSHSSRAQWLIRCQLRLYTFYRLKRMKCIRELTLIQHKVRLRNGEYPWHNNTPNSTIGTRLYSWNCCFFNF